MSEPQSPQNGNSTTVTDDRKSQRSSVVGSPRTSSKRRSRSRERRERDHSSSRHRSHRDDRDRDRERDAERRTTPGSRDRRDRDRDRDRRKDDRDRDRDRRRDREREDRDKDRDRRRKREESPGSGDHHSKRARDDTEHMDVDSQPNGNGNPASEKGDRSPASSGNRRGSRRSGDFRSPRYDDRDKDYDRRGSRSGRYDFDDRRRDSDREYDRGPPPRRYEDDRPPRKRPSPSYDDVPPPDDDSEARSVFVSQLAARMTARDLGYFFEDKLGEGAVKDSRIVTDRLSRRSKGIGYVELRSIDLVSKAIALSGTIVMGLPIMVQLTESERNRQASSGDLNLPPGVSAPPQGMQLYVGSLHFNLTESDIKQVFEPFGELEFVDLHRDPQTGRSKGYAFVQYKRAEDAKMALEQMEGFELAGRQLRVNTVHEKGSGRMIQDSLDEGGGNLNSVSRQVLMQKLARTEVAAPRPAPIMRPNIPTSMTSRCLLLKNMFDPEEETDPDWDKELATDVKDECESKYGPVEALKVEKESQGEIYIKFDAVDTAKKALEGLNGRWFGGKQVSVVFISDAIMQAHQ
ncbi:hypothetical protein FRC02_006899 [Tulasnella sp. 418]|nr:hypothetical protein FRC02_006899 [Tulasnella sp. 418]